MLLTLFYASATLMQSWRLRSISLNIANKLREQCSVSFYKTYSDENGINSVGASSDECDNYKSGRIVDTLWFQNMLRGVSILPRQHLSLDKWMTFAISPNLNPLYWSHQSNGIELDLRNDSDEETVFILLETNIYPDMDAIDTGSDIVMAEHFGKPFAWKIGSTLAIVLKSNVTLFTDFIRLSFMQNTLFINNYLPIIRIENVFVHGTPQQLGEFELETLLTSVSAEHNLTVENCRHHIDKLKILNLVANLRDEPSPDDYEKEIIDTKTLNGSVIADTLETNITSETASIKTKEECTILNHIDLNEISKTDDLIMSEEQLIETITQVVNESTQKSNDAIKEDTFEKTDCSKRKSFTTSDSISTECNFSQYSTLKRKKRNSDGCKPPNILVYSESNDIRSNVIETIKNILHPDRYTIYELNTEQLKTTFWIDNTTLLIVCGPTAQPIGSILIEYYLCGGKMLCLCSDVLNMVLPMYRTAEVRENELVQFSYGRWHKIQLMHHIFCYHPSPIKKHFSLDSDEPLPDENPRKPALACPGSIDLKDLHGDAHRLEVKVLGTEETWNTPSLILATDTCCNGIAVFSQVHLEADPSLYENDESKFAALKKSDEARLEIFSDLLGTQLGLKVYKRDANSTHLFPSAYFLGHHEAKFVMLENLKPHFIHPSTLKANDLTVKFYGKNESAGISKENQLSILIHSCPENFSTVAYFDALQTKSIGRLVIYAPVISSTMSLVSNLKMSHGLVVIGKKQTAGVGRHKNQWLSPDGCALFSLQLHIPRSSPLGEKIPLIQHLVSVAIVHSITSIEEYKKLDIRLKWPNDIYVNGNTKLGGLIVTTVMDANDPIYICNVGVGLNLHNTEPTTCVNDQIKAYNIKHNTKLPYLEYEQFFANVFNEIEKLIDLVQTGDFKYLYDLYYKLWLHSDAEIVIIDADGNKKLATIIGIDEIGYLLVQQPGQTPESVQPDGNTFDILRGLISAKHS